MKATEFLRMVKPRIGVMVVVVTLSGYYLGVQEFQPWVLFHTLLGVLLLGSASSVLNQVMERDHDARMERTRRRPLPAGRLTVAEATTFGVALAVAGFVDLLVFVNALTALLTLATLLAYLLAYTPLKRVTPLNTLVGAVPGAMPPVLGWTAARGQVGLEAAVLFAILFLWQLPHFLSIAWLYREDYRRGGFRMLPFYDEAGDATARQMTFQCLALFLVALFPAALQMTGPLYLTGATLLGATFLGSTLYFWRHRTADAARAVMAVSLVYLPCILLLLAWGA